MILPDMKTTMETLTLKEDAKPWVDNFLQRNNELEEIFDVLQPLLAELSMKLYPTDEPVSLGKMVEDGVKFIKEAK